MRLILSAAVTLVLLCSGATALAQEADTASIILDTTGFWRMHHEFRPPVIASADGLKPVLVKVRWLNRETAGAPADWRSPDFDDSGWLRGPARTAADSPYLYRLAMRGKFTVTELTEVDGLRLTVGYRGGAIVTVNGQEIARGHLPEGQLAPDALADGYPEEAYIDPDGKLLTWEAYWRKPPAEIARRFALSVRTLEDVPVPKRLLHKGVNIVTIEVIRSPYHEVMEAKKRADSPRNLREAGTLWQLNWATCGIERVQLRADRAAGLGPAAVRPKGFQVWNNDLVMGDFDLDFGDPSETLRPIRIVGTRNGSFSGKVVVGSDTPVKDLRAELDVLNGPGGVIGRPNIRIRYAVPWGRQYQTTERRYVQDAMVMGALTENAPDTIEVPVKTGHVRDSLRIPDAPETVWRAVCPVWVTVSVPRTAEPGTYRGTLVITARDQEPVKVPVSLEVTGWTLPDPQDYRTWVELWQSPDTLALEYKTPLWSPEHFELIGRAFDHFRDVGSRVVYIPILAHTNLGNAESMVRWVKTGAERYTYDFSPMERYLDVVLKHMGRPKIVVIWVWDVALSDIEKSSIQPEQLQKALKTLQGKGPLVTFLDPATGKTTNDYLPVYADVESKKLWQPLIEQMKERLTRRGLEGTAMFGVASDAVPKEEEVNFFAALWPNVPWVVHSHGVHWSKAIFQRTKVGYYSKVLCRYGGDPEDGRKYGWRQPELVAQLNRHWTGTLDCFPETVWRHLGEINITGEQRGVGRLGADFWPVIRDSQGRRVGRVYERYNEARWRSNDICTVLLAPGPTGPVATTRLELLREGVQECEARIFLESTLLDERLKAKLGDEFAGHLQDLLDERVRVMCRGISSLELGGPGRSTATNTDGYGAWMDRPGLAGHAWFVGSGWQDRSKALFEAADRVSQALKGIEEAGNK